METGVLAFGRIESVLDSPLEYVGTLDRGLYRSLEKLERRERYTRYEIRERHIARLIALRRQVNGWSFVKKSRKYYDDCAALLAELMELRRTTDVAHPRCFFCYVSTVFLFLYSALSEFKKSDCGAPNFLRRLRRLVRLGLSRSEGRKCVCEGVEQLNTQYFCDGKTNVALRRRKRPFNAPDLPACRARVGRRV